MNKWFNDFATKVAVITGRSYIFVLSLLFVIVWAVSGPFFHYSDTWQLIINTSTTVLTFLIVFIIQNSQNRSANSTEIKLDFILEMLGMNDEEVRKLEDLSDTELEKILKRVQKGKTATAGTKYGRTKKANTRSSS